MQLLAIRMLFGVPCMQVVESRTYNVLPVVENLFDMGNLAAVCRTADGKKFQ